MWSACCAETVKDHSSVSIDGDWARSWSLADEDRGGRNNFGEACDEFLLKGQLGKAQSSLSGPRHTGKGPWPRTIKGALTRVMLCATGWRSRDCLVTMLMPSLSCIGVRAAMTGAAISAALVMRERRETIFEA